MPYHIGLDLGQSQDFTALAVIYQVPAREVDRSKRELHLRHLERYPLRTPYPDIVTQVSGLLTDSRLSVTEPDPLRARIIESKPSLVIDNTGVGVAVSDLFKKQGLRFASVTITGGDRAHRTSGTWRVPKRDLVAALEVPFHTQRLKVAEGLQLWPVLKEELLSFRRKIDLRTAHDSYEHWRESDHDDLVLASALACWNATKPISQLRAVDIHGHVHVI
jgi:hypothetical protein